MAVDEELAEISVGFFVFSLSLWLALTYGGSRLRKVAGWHWGELGVRGRD